MKKYLITGCAGFIGSNFVYYMLKKYEDILLVNLDKLTYAGNLENLKGVEGDSRHIFVQGDICDKELVAGLFDAARNESDFGNGRYVRNVIEKAKMAQATRLLTMDFDSIESEDIALITADDIEIPKSSAKTEKKQIGFST